MTSFSFSRLKAFYARRKTYAFLQPHFDAAFYRDACPDLDGRDPLAHYIETGWREARDPTAWFSTLGYLESYPDVRQSGLNPFYHYLKFGRAERRSPFRDGAAFRISRDETAPAPPDKETDCLTHMLRRHGVEETLEGLDRARVALEAAGVFSDALIRSFKPGEYRLLAGVTPKTPIDALLHFAREGYERSLPISFDLDFDPDFYRSYTFGLEKLSERDAYRNWLTKGLPHGLPPNARRLMQRLRLEGSSFPAAFDAEIYAAADAELHGDDRRWLLLEHFLTIGAAERRPGCPLSSESASLYIAAADLLAVRGQFAQAQQLYEAVLAVIPTQTRALSGLAHCLTQEKRFGCAARVYRDLLATGHTGYSAFYWLAHCLSETGALTQALRILEEAIALFPHDHALRKAKGELLRRRFEGELADAQSCARALRREETTRRLASAQNDLLAALAGTDAPAPPIAPLRKIAIYGEHNLNQCRLYRIDQKLEQLAQAGYEACVFRAHEDLARLSERLFEFDAIIFYRVAGLPEIVTLIETARQLGVATFYEIDDLIFDPAHYPQNLDSYAGQITMEEYAGLLSAAPVFRGAAQACDYAIASTEPLARRLARLVRTGRAFVHRNGLGRVHLDAMAKAPTRRERRETVIFFGSGTRAHTRDFAKAAAPAIARLFSRHGNMLRLVLMGYHDVPPVLAPFRNQIEIVAPLWDFEAYLRRVADADINICALARDEVADCKSEIKWLEAALFGVPSVVSRTANHEETLEDGVTALLAGTESEWFDGLDHLIRDRKLRSAVGAAAKRAALSTYSPHALSENLRSIFTQARPAPLEAPTRKRLVIVNVHYPPFAIGGATRVVHDNVRHIHARYGDRFDLEIFTGIDCDRAPYETISYAHEGVRVTAVSLPRNHDSRAPFDLRMQEVFTRFLQERKPDLAHFHCLQRLSAALPAAARALKIPYVVTVHDGWWISDHQFLINECGAVDLYDEDGAVNARKYGALGATRARALRETLASAEKVVAVSEPFARIYREAGVANVIAISNGVSITPAARRTASANGRVRLGFLGGEEAHKGLPLIKAALRGRRFANLELVVVDHARGAGEEAQDIWSETPVTVLGRTPPERVGELYARMDVLLAPSLWPESYGLVAREALVCGLWVVASNRGAIGDDVVEGENGFVIDVSAPDALAATLAKIDADPARYLNAPAKRPAIRKAETQAEELAQLYSDLLAG